ncbi:hypothetical protein HRbin20_00001 [bacterium HR20]|nr:hypothetical protein HRbin20_00001 [bacterium HR20]
MRLEGDVLVHFVHDRNKVVLDTDLRYCLQLLNRKHVASWILRGVDDDRSRALCKTAAQSLWIESKRGRF